MCGLRLAALATQAGLRNYGLVSTNIKRYERRLAGDRSEQARMNRVLQLLARGILGRARSPQLGPASATHGSTELRAWGLPPSGAVGDDARNPPLEHCRHRHVLLPDPRSGGGGPLSTKSRADPNSSDVAFAGLRLVGHQQVTDAYPLRLALRRGGMLATLDPGIGALTEPKSAEHRALETLG